MAWHSLIHVSRAPEGWCIRRIAAAAGLFGVVSWSLPGLQPGPALLLAAGAALGAAVAQLYGRRVLLLRTALVLSGPAGQRTLPLIGISRLGVGRRAFLSRGLRALLHGDLLLPPWWSGVDVQMKNGVRLFVPAADAHALARRILELRPQIHWDDLSENEYFDFLAFRRPQRWPGLKRPVAPAAEPKSVET